LKDSSHNSVCAVKLLLIHALRVGAVSATSWAQLRTQTLDRADKTVQWTTPNKPVIPAIVPGRCSFLDLDKPASTKQTRETMHAMSLKARVAGKTTPQDFRRGALADLSHLPKGLLRGNATDEVASAVGHAVGTFNKNVTERYAGGSDVSTWDLRAESSWVDTRAPRIGNTIFIPRPMTASELSSYCESRGLDPSDRLAKRNARTYVRKQQEAEWRELVRSERAGTVSTPHIPSRYHQRCLDLSGNFANGSTRSSSDSWHGFI
jgi:hypothetical protein